MSFRSTTSPSRVHWAQFGLSAWKPLLGLESWDKSSHFYNMFILVLKAQILKWFAILFSSGPHLSELSTMTCQSWVALHGMAHSFFELDKAVVHVVRLVSFLSIDLIFFLHFFIDISLLQVWQCKSIRKIFSIRKPWFSLEWIFLYF